MSTRILRSAIQRLYPDLNEAEVSALELVCNEIWNYCMHPAMYVEVVGKLATTMDLGDAVKTVLSLLNKGAVRCTYYGETIECYLGPPPNRQQQATNDIDSDPPDYQRILQMPVVTVDRLDVVEELRKLIFDLSQ